MFERILLPTDGSTQAKQALDRGLALAEAWGATVHILYVAVPISAVFGFHDLSGTSLEQATADLQTAAETAIAEFEEHVLARGLATETAIRRGVPPEEILAYTAEHDIDLIVISTRGVSGVTGVGSVTKHVLRDAEIPVLVV